MAHDERIDIRQLVDLYGFAIDTQRWDLFDHIFTDDIQADYGGAAIWNDLESFKQAFREFHAGFDATQHAMTNMLVEVRGDDALGMVYGHWMLRRRGTPGGDVWRGVGWYDDAFVRKSGRWLIKRRQCRVVEWSGNLQVQSLGGGGVHIELGTTSLRAAADERSVPILSTWGIGY